MERRTEYEESSERWIVTNGGEKRFIFYSYRDAEYVCALLNRQCDVVPRMLNLLQELDAWYRNPDVYLKEVMGIALRACELLQEMRVEPGVTAGEKALSSGCDLPPAVSLRASNSGES